MPARTAYDAVSATVLTAANLDRYPGGWIGYAEVTTGQSSIGAATDLTNLSIAVTVGTSRRIRITGKILVLGNAAPINTELSIRESTTTLNSGRILQGTASQEEIIIAQWVGTPGSGSHTYKLTLAASASTVNMTASASTPAFILVEDIGPAS